MRKNTGKIILTACILVCIAGSFGCGKKQIPDTENIQIEKQDDAEEAKTPEVEKTEALESENEAESSEAFFFEEAGEQGIETEEAEKYWNRLLADNILQNETMVLTGLVINDMDGNGEKDLLVMTLDSEEKVFYGSGCVWIYMNEDEPYCFADEDASYNGWFDSFAEDIDNDGNVEIVLSTQGSGCGAVGDSYKTVFKYKNHNIERMELPTDFAEDYCDKGICISVYQEPGQNKYSAYCDYMKENLYFQAENVFEADKEAVCVGANARGFFNLRPVEYKGKNALQASEYLYGEGGIVHCVATAQFIILWDANGKPYVEKWWIEEERNCYANTGRNRIAYADGYYYYASQLDNYFLYRMKEDGSEAKCLAKVHSGTICVDEDTIYFVNLGDSKAIYKIETDGSNMQKVCNSSANKIQMSAEYIYFLDTYEQEADIHKLVSPAEAEELDSWDDDFLYRIRKDGSGKELLLTEANSYTIAAENGREVMYEGYLYYRRDRQNEKSGQWETVVMRCGLNGENEEEVCQFDFSGSIMVYRDRIYCYSISDGKIREYTTWTKETRRIPYKKLAGFCIYNGTLYGLEERKDERGRSTKVYRMESGGTQWEEIYCNDAACIIYNGYYNESNLADIYATGKDVFFRQFVSPKEGVKWFLLGEEEKVSKWEDENSIPMTRQAAMMKYTYDASSIKVEFESTDGYEEYLGKDLTHEEFYRKDESGEGVNAYAIRLPQFNEKIEGYRQINAYFKSAYEEALGYQEEFFNMLDEDKESTGEVPSSMLYEGTDYDYVYIGEDYITVAKYQYGYSGGIRSWHLEEPVTFERASGRVVSLEEFLGASIEEAVARATASIYKYMENGEGGSAKFFLQNEDVLTEEFSPEQFFLMEDGIGIYYEIYAIDCGAAGDYLFIVPYP